MTDYLIEQGSGRTCGRGDRFRGEHRTVRVAPNPDLAILLHNWMILTLGSHSQTRSGGEVKPPNSRSINSAKAIVVRSSRTTRSASRASDNSGPGERDVVLIGERVTGEPLVG